RIVAEANARVERVIREIKEAQAEQQATRAARERLESFRREVGERLEQTTGPDAGVPAPGSATDESAPATPEVSGPVRVGDQVVLDDGTAAAEVLEIDGDQAVISFDSMRLRASVDRLRKVGGRRRQEVRLGSIQQSGLPALGARTRIDLRG